MERGRDLNPRHHDYEPCARHRTSRRCPPITEPRKYGHRDRRRPAPITTLFSRCGQNVATASSAERGLDSTRSRCPATGDRRPSVDANIRIPRPPPERALSAARIPVIPGFSNHLERTSITFWAQLFAQPVTTPTTEDEEAISAADPSKTLARARTSQGHRCAPGVGNPPAGWSGRLRRAAQVTGRSSCDRLGTWSSGRNFRRRARASTSGCYYIHQASASSPATTT